MRHRRLAVPHLVECPHRESVEHVGDASRHRSEARRGEGQGVGAGGRLLGDEFVVGGMVAPGEHGPAEVRSGGDHVDPGNGVPVQVIAGLHPLEQAVEIRHPLREHQTPTRFDRQQPHGRLDDDAGQAHPADRRPPQQRVRGSGDRATSSVRQQHRHRIDVSSERAIGMMVLAVDVAGDGAADGDEPCARRHRHEEPSGHDVAQQFVEADSGADIDRARVGIEQDRPRGEPYDRPAAVLGGIAVGPPHPPSDDPAGLRENVEEPGVEFVSVGVDDGGRRRRGAAPAGQFELTTPHVGSVRPVGHGAAQPTEHLAETQRESDFEHHILGEPRQLRELTAGTAGTRTETSSEVGAVDRHRSGSTRRIGSGNPRGVGAGSPG